MKQIGLSLFHDEELPGILLLSVLYATVVLVFFHFHKGKRAYQSIHHNSTFPFVRPSKPVHHYSRQDWCLLFLISGLYVIVSFTSLGSTTFPVTTWQPSSQGQQIIFELPEKTSFNAIYTLYGEGDNNSNSDSYQLGDENMIFQGSDDLNRWNTLVQCDKGSIYEYSIYEGSWNYRYVRLISSSKNNSLTEIGFRSDDSSSFLPVEIYQDEGSSSSYPASLLIDEQDKLSADPTYMNEAYFDEVYHPRNAWEIANGEYMYATVHPLFGTNLMALSIHFFGMNPFAWRLPGAVFGVMILFALYALLKVLFERTSLCAFGTALCAADFMHLTTSRIGTLEPFSIFFIILMFYFMARYFQNSFYDTSLKQQLKILLCCGITMGVAIATKWTACYSAVGLAVILFTNWIQRALEYHRSLRVLNRNSASHTEKQLEEARHIQSCFAPYLITSILCCIVFFLIIPAVIYWLSYLPDHVWRNETWSIANVWKQNLYMYNYHINLKATHPYQSSWYQWLVDARPIWYYFGTEMNGVSHSISCFSNPLLTWAGLPAIVLVLADVIVKRDKNAWFILIGYITALGPWVLFVNRCVFAYHFYPTSIFVILAIVYCSQYLLKYRGGKAAVLIYLSAYVVLFFAFLPVTAGFGTTMKMIHALEWLPGWYFG